MDNFWKRTPALYLALLLMIGIGSAFFLPLLVFISIFPKRLFWVVALIGFLYVKLLYPSFPLEEKGSAQFHIEEVKRYAGPIHNSFVYSGKIKMASHPSFPCKIYLHPNKKPLPANRDYFFKEGILTKIQTGHYLFKPKSPWQPLPNTSSLAEWRFQKKESVRRSIHSRFKNKKVAILLTGLATGTLESRFLAFHFSAVGLSHLLAISGFHFALLSFFLAIPLKRILPEKVFALTLIVLLSSYFFYMGGAPSISRAWIGILIYLVGMLFHLRPHPVNTLGVALFCALAFDPLILTNVGFQLTFSATLGILLFYNPLEKKLTALLPKRPYDALLKMSRLDQCGYLLCTYLRKALALQGSVLTFTLPLILFHFETYPLLSLIYNLFYPLFFSILLALFLLHLDFLTAPFASFLITLIEGAPKRLLFQLGVTEAVAGGVVLIVAVLIRLFALRRIKIMK